MTKTLMAMAAVSAIAVAAPAVSQTANTGLTVRIDRIQADIQAGVRNGTITRAEAQPLREQYRQIKQLERQYSLNGLTAMERRDLQARIQNVRTQVRYAARNDLVRYGSVSFIDNNRDGWDDRDVNRDGILDRAYGQGGPYEATTAQCAPRGGIAGVLSSVLGRSNSCLQVGQVASGSLYSLPQQYWNTYRDNNVVYYRTDGRMVYQIDRRNNVVTGVYGM
jgi:hypothetical protein